VKVKVERANLEQKQLDFSLIWEDADNGSNINRGGKRSKAQRGKGYKSHK